jgi:type III pantothenate kinase
VDAGSAITVDVMQNRVHLGGYILPGLQAYQECYGRISNALDVGINPNIDFEILPQNTPDAISYGIIASITALLKETIRDRVYFTGGDGKFLAKHFDNAIYDETLVFKGMMKGLQ